MSRNYPNYNEAVEEIIEIIGIRLDSKTEEKIKIVIQKYAEQQSDYDKWSNSVSWDFGPG